MAFSFNPGQTTPQGVSPAAAPFAAAPLPGASPTGAVSVPDSPFLFMQNREAPITVNGYLQMVLALVAALGVFVAITVFAYSFFLASSIESKKETIAEKESTFKDYPLTEMKRFSDRAGGLNTLLKGYLSARSPLKFLEDVVEKKVFFSEFTLTKDQKSGLYTIGFVAVTDSYPVLVQQLSALNLSQYSKVIPKTKLDKFTQKSDSKLNVRVSAPILAQGMLSDDVVFMSGTAQKPPVSIVPPAETATTTP